MYLIYRLPDWILVDFCRDLDLEFSRSNMDFAISQPKMVRLPGNKKANISSRPQICPSDLTMTLTLNFQDQIWNLLYRNQKWSGTKIKHINCNQGNMSVFRMNV